MTTQEHLRSTIPTWRKICGFFNKHFKQVIEEIINKCHPVIYFNNSISPSCSFCQQFEETIIHLFGNSFGLNFQTL